MLDALPDGGCERLLLEAASSVRSEVKFIIKISG
jgi:hypothetical protein